MTADEPCMIDNRGRRMARWLPHMQSEDFLRQAISRGERTDECWAELKDRNERVHAARAAIARERSR